MARCLRYNSCCAQYTVCTIAVVHTAHCCLLCTVHHIASLHDLNAAIHAAMPRYVQRCTVHNRDCQSVVHSAQQLAVSAECTAVVHSAQQTAVVHSTETASLLCTVHRIASLHDWNAAIHAAMLRYVQRCNNNATHAAMRYIYAAMRCNIAAAIASLHDAMSP